MYNFDDIVGQNLIVDLLQNSIYNDSVNHLYIIDGEHGCGKTLIAKTFAKTLLCENSGVNPCNKCSSCLSFDTDNNPDIFYITPKDKKSIGADIVREDITENALIRPFKYKYKIYIVEEFNLFTVQAQNAFLKTLEEPPSYVKFLLMTTDYTSLLETILSRSVILKITPLKKQYVYDYLYNIYPDKDIELYSSIANGNIGTALSLIENDNYLIERNLSFDTIKSLITLDIVDSMNLYDTFSDYKNDFSHYLTYFLYFYRDILVYKVTKNADSIIQKDKLSDYIIMEEAFSEKNLLKKIDFLNDSIKKLQHNTNPSLTIETLMLKLKEK